MILAEDPDLFHVVDSATEALDWIEKRWSEGD